MVNIYPRTIEKGMGKGGGGGSASQDGHYNKVSRANGAFRTFEYVESINQYIGETYISLY